MLTGGGAESDPIWTSADETAMLSVAITPMETAYMLLAQAKELTDVTQKAIQSAEVYGLIGYLLVAVFLVFVIFTGAVLKFLAPRVSVAIASTVALHTSIKETNIKQTALIDSIRMDHGDKLSDIKEVVRTLQPCPYAAPKPSQPVPQNLTPIAHGV